MIKSFLPTFSSFPVSANRNGMQSSKEMKRRWICRLWNHPQASPKWSFVKTFTIFTSTESHPVFPRLFPSAFKLLQLYLGLKTNLSHWTSECNWTIKKKSSSCFLKHVEQLSMNAAEFHHVVAHGRHAAARRGLWVFDSWLESTVSISYYVVLEGLRGAFTDVKAYASSTLPHNYSRARESRQLSLFVRICVQRCTSLHACGCFEQGHDYIMEVGLELSSLRLWTSNPYDEIVNNSNKKGEKKEKPEQILMPLWCFMYPFSQTIVWQHRPQLFFYCINKEQQILWVLH